MLFSLTPNQMKNASNTENTYKPEISTITGMRHAAHTAFRQENNVLTFVYRTATTLQYSSNEYHKDHHKYYEREFLVPVGAVTSARYGNGREKFEGDGGMLFS